MLDPSDREFIHVAESEGLLTDAGGVLDALWGLMTGEQRYAAALKAQQRLEGMLADEDAEFRARLAREGQMRLFA